MKLISYGTRIEGDESEVGFVGTIVACITGREKSPWCIAGLATTAFAAVALAAKVGGGRSAIAAFNKRAIANGDERIGVRTR